MFFLGDAHTAAIEELKAAIERERKFARVLLWGERGAILERGFNDGRQLRYIIHGR